MQAITVGQPDGKLLYSNKGCKLKLKGLPEEALRGHALPALSHSSIISIGRFCDEGCKAVFTKDEVTISKHDKELLQGIRDMSTGLWRLPMVKEELERNKCNNMQSTNISNYIKYIHAALFSPTPSTWIKVIKAVFLIIGHK